MKVTYTGRHGKFTPQEEKKLATKFTKLAKVLDRGGEREAHVILAAERHVQRAEITVRFHDHPLVGIAASADEFTAILNAADKLEKQVLKLQTKWRDTKRGPKPAWTEEAPEEVAATAAVEAPDTGSEKRVFRVNRHHRQKPMTLEEAIKEAHFRDRDVFVFRDPKGKLMVLHRTREGKMELIEAP